MKILIGLIFITFSLNTFACPNLQGSYNKCYSEIRKVKGEYIVDQYQENNYEVFNIELAHSAIFIDHWVVFKYFVKLNL